jgi:hypothetical protein
VSVTYGSSPHRSQRRWCTGAGIQASECHTYSVEHDEEVRLPECVHAFRFTPLAAETGAHHCTQYVQLPQRTSGTPIRSLPLDRPVLKSTKCSAWLLESFDCTQHGYCVLGNDAVADVLRGKVQSIAPILYTHVEK